MTNVRPMKKAWLLSLCSLVLCFSMLVGTTFAWFTDSVTSAGNVIQTGSLDVTMSFADGKEAVPAEDSEDWKNADGVAIFDYDNWEPGYAVARHLKIANNGTLALKYWVRIIADGEVSDLSDVIDVYYLDPAEQLGRADLTTDNYLGTLTQVMENLNSADSTAKGNLKAGENHTVTLVMKMNENAGNVYQEKSIGSSFSIQLLATQLDSEEDSFDGSYDADAEYQASVSPLVPTAQADGTYQDITLTTFDVTPVTVTVPSTVAAVMAGKDVEKIQLSVSELITTNDGESIKVSYSSVAILDEDGNEVDLSQNTDPLEVKLYVGAQYAGQTVTVYHDNAAVATASVDSVGYVVYYAAHFCEVSITFGEVGSIIVDGEAVDSLEKIESEDLTKLIEMRVGSHFYTVSIGMAKSWTENSSIAGQISASIYTPEDLFAYSLMYKNGDLAETGSHSTLTIVNDLDFNNKSWTPIGRFYTDINGNGKTISNLDNSLFGCVYDCQMKDLTLANVTVSGSAAGVIAKELAGDIVIENVTIAGTNTVTYAVDGSDNWPEEGMGVGAITGVSLIAYNGNGKVDVTLTGIITVNYNDVQMGNKTGLALIGVDEYFGVNIYKANQNCNVTLDGGSVITSGDWDVYVAEGLYKETIDSKEYLVSSGAGLATLNENWGVLANKETVITFTDDIDFTGYTWTPVDSHADTSTQLKELNGNGYTLYGLTVNGQAMFKRFAGSGDVTIKNITFDHAKVVSQGINTSILTVQTYQNVLLDNVDVTNSYIEGTYKVAPLIGTVYNESATTVTATLKNCDVSNTVVKSTSYDFCTTGMVAFVYAGDNDQIKFEGCTISNVTIIAPDDGYDAHAWIYTAGSNSLYDEAEGVTVSGCKHEVLS